MKCAKKDCNNKEIASGMCYECMDKHLGITKTIITQNNSYVIEGQRVYSGLGGAIVVELGDVIREWN